MSDRTWRNAIQFSDPSTMHSEKHRDSTSRGRDHGGRKPAAPRETLPIRRGSDAPLIALRGVSYADVSDGLVAHRLCRSVVTTRALALDSRRPDALTLYPYCMRCDRRVRIEELIAPAPNAPLVNPKWTTEPEIDAC